MLLYMASRAQLVEEVIRPALERGAVVISDRYLLANVVYQGYAGGLGVDRVSRVGLEAAGPVGGDVLVLTADTPLLTGETLVWFLERHRSGGHAVSILTADVPDPSGYGRIVRAGDDVRAAAELQEREVWPGQRPERRRGEIPAGGHVRRPVELDEELDVPDFLKN